MEQAGLRDGMTISFHHHLRNGDYVLNMVLDEAAKMGVHGQIFHAHLRSREDGRERFDRERQLGF